MARRILLTYAQADERWAKIVAQWLERAHYEVEANARGPIQTVDISAGYHRVMVLLSKAYLDDRRDWVEWLEEASDDDRIVQVVRDDTEPPLFGQRKTLVDMTGRTSDESRIALLRAIEETSRPQRTAKPTEVVVPRSPRQDIAWRVPKPSPNFTGDFGIIDGIQRGLRNSGRVALVAKDGIGGIGTSELAANYVGRYRGGYDLVAWVDARRAEFIVAALADLAVVEQISIPAGGLRGAALAMRRNLQARTGPKARWLLVFDGAQSAEHVAPWIPSTSHGGHVLITSRHRVWAGLAKEMAIQPLRQTVSAALLRSLVDDLSQRDAERIAGQLDNVPVTLIEAARAMSVGSWRVPAAELSQRLEQTAEELRSHGVMQRRIALASVVDVLAGQVEEADPMAWDMLQGYAVLAALPLPVAVLAALPSPAMATNAVSVTRLRQSIAVLRRFGWLDNRGEVTLHLAVQESIAASTTAHHRLALKKRAEAFLAAAQPGRDSDHAAWYWWHSILREVDPEELRREAKRRTSPELLTLAAIADTYLNLSRDAGFASELESRLPVDSSNTITVPAPEPAPSDKAGVGRSFLLLATEWLSAHGGLSTLNRQFAIALAAFGHHVCCIVPGAMPTEVEHARAHGVTLVEAVGSLRGTAMDALARPENIPVAFSPDFVVGHSRVTGPAAQQLCAKLSDAKRLHMVHMSPDEIEWHKLDRADSAADRAESRAEIEYGLGSTAHRVVAIGPRIYDRCQLDISIPSSVTTLRLDPGFDPIDDTIRQPPEAGLWRILLFGRAEDKELKGIDIAAKALGHFATNNVSQARLEFVVRGAREGTADELREQILRWVGAAELEVTVRTFSPNTERLDRELRTASLVLMPSRAEGFGLAGLEAIIAGTPVLISGQSGLAELLKDTLEPESLRRIVVPMRGNEDDITAWSAAIKAELHDRDASFQRAEAIRRHLAAAKPWKNAIADLTSRL